MHQKEGQGWAFQVARKRDQNNGCFYDTIWCILISWSTYHAFCCLGVISSISLVLLHFNLNGFLVQRFPLQFHPSDSTPDMSIITKAGPKRKIRGTGNRTKAWVQKNPTALRGAHQCFSHCLRRLWGAGYNKDGCGQPERVIGKLGNQNWGQFWAQKTNKNIPKRPNQKEGYLHFTSVQTPTWPYHSLQSKAFLKLFFWSNHNNLCIRLQTSKTKENTCSYEIFMTSSRTSNASPSLQLPDLCNSYNKEGCKQASKLLVSTDFDNFFELMKQILSICQCLCIHIYIYMTSTDTCVYV